MNKKTYKICIILDVITCVCFCLSAVLGLVTKNSTIYDVLIDAVLALLFACSGVLFYKDWKKETPQDKSET